LTDADDEVAVDWERATRPFRRSTDVDDLRLDTLEASELVEMLDFVELREAVEGSEEVRELTRLDFVDERELCAEDWVVPRETVLLDLVELRELKVPGLLEDFAALELDGVRELAVEDLRLPLVLLLLDFCELDAVDFFEVLGLLAFDEDEVRELEVVGWVEPAALDLVELRVEEVDVREDEARDELLRTREIVVDELREDTLDERRDVEDDLPSVSKIVMQNHHETNV
jgi:hypothetical protein